LNKADKRCGLLVAKKFDDFKEENRDLIKDVIPYSSKEQGEDQLTLPQSIESS
jgi:hypothetical protein